MLPSDTPEWAKMLSKSMHDKFDALELELGKGVQFANEIAREAKLRSESNSGKIAELSGKFLCFIGKHLMLMFLFKPTISTNKY